jgi:hypothetical protein
MSKYDDDVREKLHNLNLVILRTFIEHFHRLNGISGVQAIPFMQVTIPLKPLHKNGGLPLTFHAILFAGFAHVMF